MASVPSGNIYNDTMFCYISATAATHSATAVTAVFIAALPFSFLSSLVRAPWTRKAGEKFMKSKNSIQLPMRK
jgi:hypothetical protein